MDRAKQLFFKHNGIKHWMWHDGNLEEYNSYSISKEQEKIWYEELQTQYLNQLENGADPNKIFYQLEAIAAVVNDDKYLGKAIEVMKNRSKKNKQ